MNTIDRDKLARLLLLAKEEDLGPGDLSANLLPDPQEEAVFNIVQEESGVFAGREIAADILASYDSAIRVNWTERGQDGFVTSDPPAVLAQVSGPVGTILSAERVLLNFLQRLCGIATLTSHYVKAVSGTKVSVLDTRKTTPGWRMLEKYAVRCGGGVNHRQGLYDAVMIKDNHIAGIETKNLAEALGKMVHKLQCAPSKPDFVVVEADTLDQAKQIMSVDGVDVILLDNFSNDQLASAVSLRNEMGLAGIISLEASGGVRLDTIGEIAQTGVDRISVGAITHSATALSLKLERV